ncbi:MAG: TlpA family protein disulfide reductase [Nitrospiraceae bacterium]|nr:TlpA family protein disulfide reductase [Nitrospiraceae bacterium]
MNKKGIILIAILAAGVSLFLFIAAKNNLYVKQPIAVGLAAPEISLIDAASKKRLAPEDLKGKVLFVSFWASWCQPCKDEMPSLNLLNNEFKNNNDFKMLTILYRDNPKDAFAYLKKYDFNLPVLIDIDNYAAKAYGLTGVPETYIVDKSGVLAQKIIGPYKWDSPDVFAFITKLLD